MVSNLKFLDKFLLQFTITHLIIVIAIEVLQKQELENKFRFFKTRFILQDCLQIFYNEIKIVFCHHIFAAPLFCRIIASYNIFLTAFETALTLFIPKQICSSFSVHLAVSNFSFFSMSERKTKEFFRFCLFFDRFQKKNIHFCQQI